MAWVVLVAESVQQAFSPTTKINFILFYFSSWLRLKDLSLVSTGQDLNNDIGPDRNAEGMAIGFGCVVVVCLIFFGNSEFLAGNSNR